MNELSDKNVLNFFLLLNCVYFLVVVNLKLCTNTAETFKLNSSNTVIIIKTTLMNLQTNSRKSLRLNIRNCNVKTFERSYWLLLLQAVSFFWKLVVFSNVRLKLHFSLKLVFKSELLVIFIRYY